MNTFVAGVEMISPSTRYRLSGLAPLFASSMGVLSVVGACSGQSPGGVSTGLAVWYKADLNVVGSPVSAWNTSGGSAAGFNITQATAGNRPAIIPGSTNYKRYNYNTRIDFTASSSTRLENTAITPDLYGTLGNLFLVTDQPQVNTGTGLSYSSALATQRIQLKPHARIQTSTGINGSTHDYSQPAADYGYTAASILAVSGLNSGVARRNSVAVTCNNCPPSALYNPVITTGLRVGRNGLGSEYVDCDMGEIIIYSGALTTAEINRVESYLALKYGITRGGNAGTGSAYNYLNSSGTTIWDKTTNAGYNNDIAGIGRDDGSALIQKQSISVNTSESVSIGLVSIDASNTANANTFSSNNSFLVWGNNGSAQTTVFSDPTCFSNMPTGVQAKVQRTWKAQVTNYAQTVTVGFETSSLVGSSPISNLRLLVDNDGANWSNATVVSGAVLDGTRIEFAGVTLSSANPYFTLATINYAATPLPIELLFFNAECADPNAVELSWATASESNSARFDVERSLDGMLFEKIGEIISSGSSVVRNDYDLTDPSPYPGTSYYRLKQVDLDGTFTYTAVRVVTFATDKRVNVYPNPARDMVRIAGLHQNATVQVEMFNEAGAQVPFPAHALKDGLLDVSTLPKGLYLARIGDQVARIIKE